MAVTAPEAEARYVLSFSVGGLLVKECVGVAAIYLAQPDKERNWSATRKLAQAENVVQARTQSSGARVTSEAVKRLACLDDAELELLLNGTSSERAQLAWVAACRKYAFVGEFATQVLREHFLTLKPKLDYDDYDSFFRSKALWHPELNDLTDATYKKLRSELFRMMKHAELLSDKGDILPVVLSPAVTELLRKSDREFFPWHGAA